MISSVKIFSLFSGILVTIVQQIYIFMSDVFSEDKQKKPTDSCTCDWNVLLFCP